MASRQIPRDLLNSLLVSLSVILVVGESVGQSEGSRPRALGTDGEVHNLAPAFACCTAFVVPRY